MNVRAKVALAFLFAVPTAFAAVACVGDDPVATGDSGAPTATSTTTTAPVPTGSDAQTAPDGQSVTDSSTGDGAVAPLLDAAPDGATLIDGASLDGGKPMPVCRVGLPTGTTGAFNQRCRASASNPTPGGRILNGSYVLSLGYGSLYCPSAYVIGSAEVFSEGTNQFLRFSVLKKTSTTDPGTPATGTYWLDYDSVSGRLRAEEMCDGARKGTVRTGVVSVVVDTVTFTFVDGQEAWDRK